MTKSKLPDLDELTSMAGKLFNGIKSSVNEIIDDYKSKRTEDEPSAPVEKEATKAPAPKKAKKSRKK